MYCTYHDSVCLATGRTPLHSVEHGPLAVVEPKPPNKEYFDVRQRDPRRESTLARPRLPDAEGRVQVVCAGASGVWR